MTAFALNQADLAFVLKQIKIAEAHANGAALTEIRLTATGEVITDASQYHPETGAFLGDATLPRAIPDPHVPNGLRTVDGSYNNLSPVEGREVWGASGEPMPRLFAPNYVGDGINDGPGDVDNDTMPFGPGMIVTNNNYGVTNGTPMPPTVNGGHTGNVADADPRTISNLVVDMTINNPAALVAALAFAGISGGEALAIVGQVQALMEEARLKHAAVAGAPAAAAIAVAAAQLVVDDAAEAQVEAQTDFDDAQLVRDNARGAVTAAEVALAGALAAETAQNPIVAAARVRVTETAASREAAVSLAAETETAKDTAAIELALAQQEEQQALQAYEDDSTPENLAAWLAAREATRAAVRIHDDAVDADTNADAALVVAQNAHAAALGGLQQALDQRISLDDAVETAQQTLEGLKVGLAGAEAALAAEALDLAAANKALAAAEAKLAAIPPTDAAATAAAQAAAAAADAAVMAEIHSHGVETVGESLVIPNVAPDEGLSAPFNAWMTFFGQFFDHGLDLISKGGNGTVYVPLANDDPLVLGADGKYGTTDDLPHHLRFMAITRSTTVEGEGGEPTQRNVTTSFVDQNQTYTSHASHQVFLREYALVNEKPVATGKLLGGENGGLATWADVKKQAAEMLGIELTDRDVGSVPMIRTDAYGEFVRGPDGLPFVLASFLADGTPIYVQGNLENPVNPSAVALTAGTVYWNGAGEPTAANMSTLVLGDVIRVGSTTNTLDPAETIIVSAARTPNAFLDDIAHNAVPVIVAGVLQKDGDVLEFDPITGEPTNSAAVTGNTVLANTRGQNVEYDNELLDRHFITGDGRGNENIGLTTVHHIFHSEHNRQVDAQKLTILQSGNLAFINEWLASDIGALPPGFASLPALAQLDYANTLSWDGERLFQAARFATEMQYQHLVFEEFARKIQPMVDVFVFNNITDVDPTIFSEFANVVYRFGHSMLTENMPRIGAEGEAVPHFVEGAESELGLIEAFLNPVLFDKFFDSEGNPLSVSHDEGAAAIVRGMTIERGNEIDEFVVDALRNSLLGLPLDLAAINIARGRDTGMPTLNQAREQLYAASGSSFLTPYTSWTELAANLKNPISVVNFIAAYGTHETIVGTLEQKRDAAWLLVFGGTGAPADRMQFLNSTGAWNAANSGLNSIDLWIGGLAEKKMPFGGMLGSTFNAVFELQMENLQDGDRFYYLTRTQGQNFLNALEQNSFAKMIMANTSLAKPGADGIRGTADDVVERHIGVDSFAAYDYVLEVDKTKQADYDPDDESASGVDPTGNDPVLEKMGLGKVVRDDPGTGDYDLLTPGHQADPNYIRFQGGEHIVVGGTNNNDTIITDFGDDGIWGDAGDDRIESGAGVDLVNGGAGDDVITDSGDSGDFIKGDEGDDVIANSNGVDILMGGTGKDVIFVGVDLTEVFGGAGDDFILGGDDMNFLLGNEGDDWIEGGGGFDTTAGDNSELFFNSAIKGHDVMFAGNDENDFDGESGDDIMVQGESVMRNEGMFGFDWAIFKGVSFDAHADMRIPIFTTEEQDILRNRFDSTEALSGWNHNDTLIGDNRTAPGLPGEEPDVGGAVPTVSANENVFFNDGLDGAGIRRIEGLGEVLGLTPVQIAALAKDQVYFEAGNIILGGAGSDTITGNGGDDILDGDRWLNVRISIKTSAEANSPEIATVDSLKHVFAKPDGWVAGQPLGFPAAWEGKSLFELLVDRTVKPGQMHIVREILTDNSTTDVDTAVFNDIRSNYTITRGAGGTLTVAHTNLSDPAVDDGTDTLRNFERVQFADGTVDVALLLAQPFDRLNITFADGNVGTLSATFTNLVDPTVTVQWQALGANGSFANIPGATALTFTPGGALAGVELRVVAIWQAAGFGQQITPSVETGFVGTAADDEIEGTIGANVILGLDGDDRIEGTEGDDILDGGLGIDRVDGGLGDDTVSGGAGDDILIGRAGIDTLAGGDGDDTITGGHDNDRVDGGAGTDTAAFEGPIEAMTFDRDTSGNLVVFDNLGPEGDGRDTLISIEQIQIGETAAPFTLVDAAVATGTAGADIVVGRATADTLAAGAGNDLVFAAGGNDTIRWNLGDGRDFVDGGADFDRLWLGGSQGDFVVYDTVALAGAALGPTETFRADTEKVVTRGGVVIAELKNVEEVVYNTAPTLELNGFDLVTRTSGDDFTTRAYTNNNAGTTNPFTTPWTESGDDGSATAGTIQVTAAGTLTFGPGNADDSSVTRSFNLEGARSAVVSFSMADTNVTAFLGLLDDEQIFFEFAADGTNFETLETFNGNNGGNQSFTLPTDVPFSANAAIRFRSNNTLDATETFSIDNLAINAVFPQLAPPPTTDITTSYVENAAAIPIASEPRITDDFPPLASARIVLTNAFAGDQLVVPALGGGIVAATQVVGSTIVVTLTGAASPTAYQAAIQSIGYRSISDNPNPTPRVIEVSVNDGIVNSAVARTTVNVTPVNDLVNAVNDTILTNVVPGTSLVVPESILLANDIDPDTILDITTVAGQNGLTATLNPGSITVTDTGVLDGTFTYVTNGGPDVATVTLDTVVATTTFNETFGTTSYTDSDGAWTQDWTEGVGDDGSSTLAGGQIRINNARLEFDGTPVGTTNDGAVIQRALTPPAGALSATISYNFGENIDAGETVLVQFSRDGTALQDVQTITSASGATGNINNFVLTGPFTADAFIRFTVSAMNNDTDVAFVDNLAIAFTTPATTVTGGNGAEILIGDVNGSALNAGGGNDTVIGGLGNDTIDGGTGDDIVVWNANASGPTDGRDFINGSANTDTVRVEGSGGDEAFIVYSRAAALTAGIVDLNGATEIVITRNGQVITELDNVEEIVINTGAGINSVTTQGNFTPTTLSTSTITIEGGTGNDTVDISGLLSAHRIVFRSNGGNDTIVGTLRPQDVVELASGQDLATYTLVDNATGTKSFTNGTHSITFTGAVPPQFGGDSSPDDDAIDGAFEYSPSDIEGLEALVRGQTPPNAGDDDVPVGYRDLSGYGNNEGQGQENWGAADQAFIRLTEARYGDPDANGNRAINPIFKDLDPRVISNILGDQEAGLPKAGNDANAFFMAFGQYVDHGLDFLPKGGNGTIAIGAPGGGQPGSGNPADLTRGTIIGYDEDGNPLHKNQTSPYVDQNQAYGSHSLIGQFLREGDGHGGLGAHLLAGAPDPSNPDFNLLPTLRELIEHHWTNDTVFVHATLPGGEISFRDYYTDYQVSSGVTGTLFTPGANGQPGAFDPGVLDKFVSNFMGSTHPLLLDTNPFISVLDHYVAGDGRANENFALTSIHTIWARNHNHHVEGLKAAGFEGTDEELYQAAKMVNEAEYQRVVFDEYVEVLLGGLRSEGTHGFEEYDPDTNAAISHEFAAAAFRFGHSLVSETLTVLDANGNPVAVPLVDAFLNPSNAQGVFSAPLPPGYTPAPGYAQHGVNAIIGGTISQASEAVDFNIVDAVRDNLTRVSADLFAFNVARGWDVGLGTLNQIRMDLADSNSRYVQEAVGFAGGNVTPYTSWEDFQQRNGLSDAVIAQFKQAYPDLVLTGADIGKFQQINPDITLVNGANGAKIVKGIDRVDFWVGGLAEKHINGGIVGQTFWVVLHEQFERLQDADRFYYISRFDNFDFYENFIDGQEFADIVARNTGMTDLPEHLFEVSNDDTTGNDEEDDDTTNGDDDTEEDDDDTTDGDDDTEEEDDDDTTDGDDDTEEDDDDTTDGDDDTEEDDDDTTDGDDDTTTPPPVVAGEVKLGTPQADVVSGAAGDDTLSGLAGDDVVSGNAGDDVISGAEGNDLLQGHAGRDYIMAGAGDDTVFGGEGADMIFGDAGADRILAGEGDDFITPGTGNDTVFAGDGNDLIVAEAGDGTDTYYGDAGIDTLDMSAITTSITADLGTGLMDRGSVSTAGSTDVTWSIENFVGGSAADTITAGKAVNVIDGGGGADTFKFLTASDANGDTIVGFRPGDKIDLSAIDANLGVAGDQSFTLVNGAPSAGQLAVTHETRGGEAYTVIEGHLNGDGQADFKINVQGTHDLKITDFAA